MSALLTYPALFLATASICLVLTSAIASLLRAAAVRAISRLRGGLALPPVRAPLHARALLLVTLSIVAAAAAGERPVYGLAVVFFFPLLLPAWLRRRRAERAAALDVSSLSFLHALRGLVEAGESLPTALFRLSGTVQAPFASTLGSFLDFFEQGRPLADCLERFRRRSSLRVTGTFLAMLEMVYTQGLSVLPLLDRMLPILEREHDHRERIRRLRRATAGQIAIAAGVPAILWGAMRLLQPETLEGFTSSALFLPLVAAAIAVELLGVAVIWRVSTFY